MNTYTYYTYFGRDRDDWAGPHTVKASNRDEAIRKAQQDCFGSCETVWKKTFKIIES